MKSVKPDCLSSAEQQLIAWFRTTDDRGQDWIMRAAQLQARDHPRPPPPPRLKVVAGDDQPKTPQRRRKAPELHLV
ncbi:hypothetical protein [Pseudoduganella violaceinigra]|uniref:hypothetical protein n=1 Tax=Pseudoduganella violaceinigra TaxID=246602 RepID=UPI0012B5537F|nr:hypothetical protein [Pseudoduganella violaceinigra]